MPAGGFTAYTGRHNYPGKITWSVIIACCVASSGGLIFGYDIGISGLHLLLFSQKLVAIALFFLKKKINKLNVHQSSTSKISLTVEEFKFLCWNVDITFIHSRACNWV
jgi:hypothetical protein